MTTDFSITVLVDSSLEQAFNAINNVRGWWSEEIEGETNKFNAEFHYHYEDLHNCDIQVVEFIPQEKVVWLVKRNYFKFTEDQTEWNNTRVIFEITERDGKAEITMTHEGLTPGLECYDICSKAWGGYITKSLVDLITTGKGKPNATGKPSF